MWALLPLQPLRPWPTNTIYTTKLPPRRHFTAVVSLQDGQEMGSLGQAVVSSLKSNEPKHQNTAKSKTKTPPPRPPEQQQLSGADILMALQRATAQKAKKKKEKRDITAISKGRNNSEKEDEGIPNFSDVRPLCIKTEWNDRLEELERKLQKLIHS